jgi:hypothetical protein
MKAMDAGRNQAMRAHTSTISINATREAAIGFLRDPENLPRWAVGFAKSVRNEGNKWVVSTGGGEIGLRIETDPALGVVDFYLSPAPGVEGLAASRVIPSGSGIEYIFTQFQAPDMPDDVFEKNIKAVGHELTVLKAQLEIECPL